MQITKKWLTEKKACQEGIAWFAKNCPDSIEHEELYRKLIAVNRRSWAGWLCVNMLPTTETQVEFAIRCVLKVYTEESFVSWANNWLNGTDRSSTAAATATVVAAVAAEVVLARAAAREARMAWMAEWTAWAAEGVAASAAEGIPKRAAAWAVEGAAMTGVDLLTVMSEMRL